MTFSKTLLTTALTTLALTSAAPVLAAGSSNSEAPKPTQTTEVCEKGTVWSKSAKACVTIESSNLSDLERLETVRELAHAGRYDDTLKVLATVSDQSDDLVLTYRGFTHRKMGNVDTGMGYYAQALAKNPNNILARSYMGQGLVELGDLTGAWEQLTEIQARGGQGTWAEASLRTAIQTGKGYGH